MPAAQATAIEKMIVAYETADKKWIPIFHKRLEVVQVAASERAKLASGAGKIWAEWEKAQNGKGRPGSEMLKFVQASVAKHSK